MKFEREKAKPIDPVSEKQLLRGLGYMLRPRGCRIAVLTASDGSYVQVGGGGVCCALEWRSAVGRHFRASQHPPVVPWPGVTKLHVSGGFVSLRQEEFFRMVQVQDVFLAFLRGEPFASYIQWRDISDEVEGIIARSDKGG